MTENTSLPRFERAVRGLGIAGGVFAAVALLSCVVMLLLTWAQIQAPAILTWLTMFLLPVAFILLLVSLILLMIRRRNS